jgi:NAD+ synthetase
VKVYLSQVNPTVGALAANAARIEQEMARAEALGADVCLLPELALTGYPPQDLVLDPTFVAENLRLARAVAARARRVTAVFGFVEPGAGGTLHNAAAVAQEGVIAAVARKLLLPTYDVFDEARYFRPGSDPLLVSIAGRPTGILICEDVWNDRAFWGRSLYPREPVQELANRGMEALLVLSASPFSTGRVAIRVDMMRAFAERHRIAVAHLNQVGGNDSLVFDGSSLALDRDGGLLALLEPFAEESRLVDLDGKGEAAPPARSDAAWAHRALVLGLRDYVKKCGFERVLLGLSGGIDSALVACLAVEALGAARVTGVSMPSRYTSPQSREDARSLATALGIHLLELSIEPAFTALIETLRPAFGDAPPGVAEENLQARIRGNLLMALSNKHGHLVLSTGNKSELAVGYCTLYGDMSGGLAVISDLPKGMVYEVARVANETLGAIPERVFTRPPTAELRANQKDEDSLPPYPLLDQVLKLYIEEGLGAAEIVGRGLDPALVRRVVDLVDRNEYKRRQAAPGLRVTSKAFGPGRRMPIARAYPAPAPGDSPS